MPDFVVNGTPAGSPGRSTQPVGAGTLKLQGSEFRPKWVIRSSQSCLLVSQTPAFHRPGMRDSMEAFDLKWALNSRGGTPFLESIAYRTAPGCSLISGSGVRDATAGPCSLRPVPTPHCHKGCPWG